MELRLKISRRKIEENKNFMKYKDESYDMTIIEESNVAVVNALNVKKRVKPKEPIRINMESLPNDALNFLAVL